MLFDRRSLDGIADGSITLTFRRWKRPQAVGGRRYRTMAGIIETESVDVVEPDAITGADARRAGRSSAGEVIGALRGPADLPIYRIAFHLVKEPDPRHVLAHDADLDEEAVAVIDGRLDRLDRASPRGPWTASTLETIARHPGVRAGDLATGLGRDRDSFKLDVRKLKNLGLTISLLTGYRLSPRGEAYLRSTGRPPS